MTQQAATAGMSDTELASRIAAGDQQAFVLLMRRHNQSLYRTARSILKDDAEAEDVVQDAYLLAYRGIDKFRGDAKLSTWLTRIVVNEAIARARKSSRRAEVIRLNDSPTGIETTEEAMTETPSEQPEQSAVRAEMRRILERKIDDLPEAFRTVFVLRALEEMTVEEVATCLSIPENTVRTRFFRARALLREALLSEVDFAFADAFSFAGARCDRIVAGVLARLDSMQAGDS
ncbi:RNA polymerase sigma factor [Noviherbaspirillum massiliense]|uniref:RNA polymerase sigma factor n=1 Tax=Noviherbaspirillum massiliense TaxID=1465823 RepID=UPI00035C2921